MVALSKCICGASPQVKCIQVAEDAEEAWVECPKCGRHTDRIVDAYCDFNGAEDLWMRNQILEKDFNP